MKACSTWAWERPPHSPHVDPGERGVAATKFGMAVATESVGTGWNELEAVAAVWSRGRLWTSREALMECRRSPACRRGTVCAAAWMKQEKTILHGGHPRRDAGQLPLDCG
jgi:hypothetical protein